VKTLLLSVVFAAAPLKVGVTLHPVYSWARGVTQGLPVEVVPVISGDVDVGAYQPQPQDVARLADIDVLLVNGLGHDDFVDGLLKASGNTRCVTVKLNEGLPILPVHQGTAPNSHTFLSLGLAAQQTHRLARALEAVKPEWGPMLRRNASAYTRRLRALRDEARTALASVSAPRVMTVHDGYAYLLQELGVTLAGVVEPAHGIVPSARELEDVVRLVRDERVDVVLAEENFAPAPLEVLAQAGARVVVVTHIAVGAFSAERFETEMRANLSALTGALTRTKTKTR
jgi:zinc transport system substrate-binding protein